MGEQIVSKYIQELFDQIANENGFKDYSMQIKSGSEAGDGFASDIFSVTIAENNSERKLHLVCKQAPTNEIRREEFFSDLAFSREIEFYNKIMPTFAKFQEEKKLHKDDQFLAYPKCYATTNGKENEPYVIVLEDLRPEGFKLWDKTKTEAFENVQLVMREIGKFHGISIAMKDQRPEEFAEFEQITDITKICIKKDAIGGMFEASFERAIASLTNENHKNILREIKNNLSLYLEHSLSEKSRFAVMSHGDLWNNNILYQFNKNNIAEDIRLLDWSVIRYASPATDLVQNIFPSTDKSFRDKEYKNLLQLYHQSLSNTVKLLGSDPDKLFTFSDLQNELKSYGCLALLLAPIVIQTALADSSQISNLDEMLKKKSDGEENRLELTTGMNEKGKLEYDRRVNEVFEDVIDKLGYYRKLN